MARQADEEKLIEKRAQKILEYLKSDKRYDGFLPRPFFIEFAGSPSSGKTTTITELDKFLRRQGFHVWRPQEGAEVIRHIERTTPVYNIRTSTYALNILLDESVGHKYDVVIFDRAMFDAYCWMMYWEEKKKLTAKEKNLYQSFFLSPFWINNIDIAYFMICDPVIAMEREQKIALSDKLGETTNPETVKILVDRYKKAFKILSPKYSRLHMIDTTKLGEKEMIEIVASDILNMMEEKAKNSL